MGARFHGAVAAVCLRPRSIHRQLLVVFAWGLCGVTIWNIGITIQSAYRQPQEATVGIGGPGGLDHPAALRHIAAAAGAVGGDMTLRALGRSRATAAVPRVVHVTWFYPADTDFRFHQALCLLAVQRFFRPEKIYFWHDHKPSGPWWVFVRQSVAHLLLVPYERPKSVLNRTVTVPEHQSDVARLELLAEYGGLYLDLDVIVVRSLDSLLHHEVTLGAETPDMLGSGLILARRNSSFIAQWRATYSSFDDREWNYHSVVIPMRLARDHPDLVHVEWFSINRPNWFEREWLYGDGKLWDWSENYAVHLWYREHNIDYNPISIRTLNTTVGEIFRHIYYENSRILPNDDDIRL